MKQPTLIATIATIALGATSSPARADGVPPSLKGFQDQYHGMYKGKYYRFDDKAQAWVFESNVGVACETWIKDATTAGVADTLAIDIPYDTPDWKAGKRTFGELKVYCARALKSAELHRVLEWMKGAPGSKNSAETCYEQYERMIANKQWEPTQMLPVAEIPISLVDPATGSPFTGTLEEARKKFCDPDAKAFVEARAAKNAEEAKYRAVLKADKLDTALAHISAAIYGPKYKELKTPEAMAKAKVWFRLTSYDDRPCKLGADIIHTITRYQFDANHKLVKDSAKDFCGMPKASAFK